MYFNENELYNLKVEELKVILKENRKYKNKNSIRRKYYWKVWNILNEKYNMGECQERKKIKISVYLYIEKGDYNNIKKRKD